MAEVSSPSTNPRVLVIASDGPGGAHLVKELASLGTTPAVTSEGEAVKAVRAIEPILVTWVTTRVDAAKLDSLVALVGRASLALVTEDAAARALLDRRGGHTIHLRGPREPSERVAARLAELARAAHEAARRDSETGLGGPRPPQPTAPQIDVALDPERAPTLGRAGGPGALRAGHSSPRPPPPSTRPPPPSERPLQPPPSSLPPHPGPRPPPPNAAPPPAPPSNAPVAPPRDDPSPSSRRTSPAASAGLPPWPATSPRGESAPASAAAPRSPGFSSAPEVSVASARPRRGRIVLAVAGALLVAGGATLGAARLGVLRIPALDARFARSTGQRGEPSAAAANVTSRPAPSAAASASQPVASASASSSATAPEAATGPDAAFAELVRPAPAIAEVMATRGPVPALANASVRQLVALAEDAHRHEQVEEALHLLGLALEKDPRSIAARALHLSVLLRAGDTPAALAQADAYLQDTPSPVLAELRGDALAARGRFAEARAAWIPDPNNRPAAAAVRSLALNGGRMRSQKGQSKEAKRLFRRAAVLDMTDLEAALALADLLLAEGDPRAAAAWAAHACELAPEVGAPHALLGRARVALGDPAGALAAFERAVKCNPSDRASVREVVRLRDAGPP